MILASAVAGRSIARVAPPLTMILETAVVGRSIVRVAPPLTMDLSANVAGRSIARVAPPVALDLASAKVLSLARVALHSVVDLDLTTLAIRANTIIPANSFTALGNDRVKQRNYAISCDLTADGGT
jgi:hypothetical protein